MYRIRLHAVRLRERATEIGVADSNIAIAARAGVPESTLSRLLAGRTTPSTETLVALSDAYDIPVDDLLMRPLSGETKAPAALVSTGTAAP